MLIYLICYAAGMLFAAGGYYGMSGFSLMLAAAYLYCYDYLRTENPLHLRALFSLFWVGGEGVSCLKLSRLQTDWNLETWACFFVAFTACWTAFHFTERWRNSRAASTAGSETASDKAQSENGSITAHPKAASGVGKPPVPDGGYANGVYFALILLTAVSAAAFVLEAAVLGYIPLFMRGVPHAYSYFHISGVHYFTVSCVLVPSAAVIWRFCAGKPDRTGALARKRMCVLAAVLLSLAIPLLCVSRFQLVFAVILAVITYMLMSGRRRIRYLLAAVCALIPFYLILTVARSHDVAYLNGIFEMKNAATPIFITQPYMYIANNYDNFNCLVEQLPRYALGVRGLFPLWALTGLKFLDPALTAYPIYVTKEELTTVTLFYDAYYDFGIAGVFVFSCALGAAASWLMDRLVKGKNPAWYLLYAQAALYFMLSFFTTWYSNPTTWFYFAATAAFAAFIEICNKYGKGEKLWYQKK